MTKVSQWTNAPLVRGNRNSVLVLSTRTPRIGDGECGEEPIRPEHQPPPCHKAPLENVTGLPQVANQEEPICPGVGAQIVRCSADWRRSLLFRRNGSLEAFEDDFHPLHLWLAAIARISHTTHSENANRQGMFSWLLKLAGNYAPRDAQCLSSGTFGLPVRLQLVISL